VHVIGMLVKRKTNSFEFNTQFILRSIAKLGGLSRCSFSGNVSS
jgi:hypothetical protein